MARRPIVPGKVLDVVAEQYGMRRVLAAPLVVHCPVDDRPLVNIGPDHPFWKRIDSDSVFKPDELKGAIVWLKPPDSNQRVQEAVEWLRGRGALNVRLLPADRVNSAPKRSGVEARVQELQISDARACALELARELSTREGVDLKAVMDAVEQSLAGAGI